MDIDEINRLQAQIDALQAQVESMRGDAEPERASRRGMLKLAAGAAVGAVAGGLALGSQSVHAGGGSSNPPTEFFYSMNPTRVYDSRWTTAGSGLASANLGRLSPNAVRTVAITRGRSESGTVTNSQFLPPAEGFFDEDRVTAVAYNLTVTGGTGVNYLAISPGDASSKPATSAINFSANQNIANSGIARVTWDGTKRLSIGDYEIKVWGGDDLGSVHFIIDITGFWWNSPSGPASPWSRGI